MQQQQRRPVATMPDAELCRTHLDVLGDEAFVPGRQLVAVVQHAHGV
ncbi:MAG: hypothetical protein QOF95_3271, partial [Pseudonocardiales bacterium]|nr:hypothetical protein [Pseudonocardiales bacterium]